MAKSYKISNFLYWAIAGCMDSVFTVYGNFHF